MNRFSYNNKLDEIRINNITIPIHGDIGYKPQEFVKAANNLLDKYGIDIPHDFPKPLVTERVDPQSKDLMGVRHDVKVNHSRKVPVVFVNCINLETKYNMNTSRLLREMTASDPVEGLLHSASVSVVSLAYADDGRKVELFPRTKTGKEPDLLIDGISSDVKYIQESDFVKKIRGAGGVCHVRHGIISKTKHHTRDDVCFDIARFIQDRCSKGIRQADMLLADLSEKSLRDLNEIGSLIKRTLPAPMSNRIVLFSWSVYSGHVDAAYYLDFDPQLWQAIRRCDKTYRIGVEWLTLPPLNPHDNGAL